MLTSGGLHLFLGPDRVRKLQRLRELERALGIHPLDRHRLEAGALAPGALVALCRQQPAASRARLVVVDEAHRLDAAGAEGLLAHAAAVEAAACVVLLVEAELSVRHPLSRWLRHARVRVERFSGGAPSAPKPFALTDALGGRDAARALAAAREQLAEGKEPLELLGLIAWQLNRWVTVKRLAAEGYSAERTVSATGLHPWQVQRLQAEVSRRPLASLDRLLSRCWQLDLDAKRGRHVPELALEQLIMEVCLTGGPVTN
jgi:DNA polymerase III delta subunit